jgi:integrase
MASLTDLSEIGRLLYAASNYESFYLRYAIKIQAHTFVRASELRFAQWSEINFVKREWKIPAERMKMSSPHIVPMSTQVVESFRALKDVTGGTIHVFRSTRKSNEDIPFSEAAVLVAMKSCLNMIGLPENAMVGHGWRSVASTILNESGKFSSDVIERQLAHMERNRTRATYNYAQYIPVRIEMMQWYSNYLDSLETRERERSNAARDYLFYRFANKKK